MRSSRISAVYTSLAYFINLSCTCSFVHDRTIRSVSPDSTKTFVIATVGIKPQLRLAIETGGINHEVYSERVEWIIQFARVYWTPDSRYVAAYLVNGVSKPALVAFDATRFVPVDPRRFRQAVADAIVSKYELADKVRKDSSFDPFEWAGTHEAQVEFIARGTHR